MKCKRNLKIYIFGKFVVKNDFYYSISYVKMFNVEGTEPYFL